jgi:hypothetical protein
MINWVRATITIVFIVLLSLQGSAQHSVPADGRFNFNLKYDVKGLDFILRLKPVTFQFDVKKFERRIYNSDAAHAILNFNEEQQMLRRRLGFIAQDVEDAAEQSGFNFSGLVKPGNKKDFYSISYESFVIPLVKAIQEQHEIITDQEEKLEQQKKRIESLEKEMMALSEKLDLLLKER